MARNTAIGPWVERARWARPIFDTNGDDAVQAIVVEQADMLDKRLNQRYIGGAFRVRLKNVPGMRTKTFLGESAWSAAERYASDAASKCDDWRWRPDL